MSCSGIYPSHETPDNLRTVCTAANTAETDEHLDRNAGNPWLKHPKATQYQVDDNGKIRNLSRLLWKSLTLYPNTRFPHWERH